MGKINRRMVQWLTTILTNANFKGFIEGKIYKGPLKQGCSFGLNCYSCPGALGSCPIGSLQAVMGSMNYKFSFYIIGFLILVGTLIGRFVCGFLCPFGLFQELIHKIPSPKFKLPKWTTYIKYAILVVFVILLPIVWVNELGMGSPAFCKFICPAGTLEAAIPLLSTNPMLRSGLGMLFNLKVAILIITIFLSILIFRPFCKVLCPLGAIYALFNPISIYRYKIKHDQCTHCGLCENTCKMNVSMYKNPNSLECIRCGECKDVCPHDAIECGMTIK